MFPCNISFPEEVLNVSAAKACHPPCETLLNSLQGSSYGTT